MTKTNRPPDANPATTRITAPMQDMLESILRLHGEKGAARVRDLAAALKLHKSTVTASLKHLADKGLVRYSPYELVALEPAGRAVAERVSGDHAVFARFLSDVLQMEDAAADAEACRLEHAAGPDTVNRLRQFAAFLAEHPAAARTLKRDFDAYLTARRRRRRP